jgi:protein O-GlcNAc transferase
VTSRLANKLRSAVEEHRSGNLAAALRVYDEVLAKSPDHADALHLKGLVAFQSGDSEEAEISIRRAIELRPGEIEFSANLAAVLLRQNRINEAEQACRGVLRMDQAHTAALTHLGTSLRRQRRLGEALQTFRAAADSSPEDASVLCNLAATLIDFAQFDEAHLALLKARQLAPSLPQVHINLAAIQRELGDPEAASASLDAAERLQPSCEICVNRGNIQLESGQCFDAVQQFQMAIAFDSSSPAAVAGLGRALQQLGHWEESLEAHRLAALTSPSNQIYQSNYLYYTSLSPLLEMPDVHRIHAAWGRQMEAEVPVTEHEPPEDAERPLRIGYVSPDFRSHATMRFFYPMLESHDGTNFHVSCYSESAKEDDVTEKLRQRADHWISTRGLDDATLAARIQRDRIDILVDLAGHTAENRLPVFARKPAPLQVSFLGYPTTTGLTRIDYFLSDAVREPTATSAKWFTEQIALLPHGACCFQASDAPDVAVSPFQTNGYVTLGSTHRLEKISPQALRLWANVMTAVPDARLLLFRDTLGGDESLRQHVLRSLTAAGIDTARVTLGWELPENHLDIYSQIDVLLDVYPWGSGTVAYDAMWMGVPIPAVAGERGGCRATASMLHNCRLPELIAESDDQYVKIVSRLAADTVRLRRLRQNLRSMMETSVCDGARFTRDIESAFRVMWQRYVNGETVDRDPFCIPGGVAA